MKRIFKLPKNVFWLGLVSFFNDFSAEMVQSVMPVFLVSVLGAPIAAVGVIEGAADGLSNILKIFSGWLSDKIGKRRKPAIWGYIIAVGVRPLLALTQTFWQVFGLRLVDRFGKGLRDSPRDALISESTPREELGKSFAYHRMMDTLGATVGPLAAFLILPFIFENYRILFLLAFGVGLFALLSFAFVKESSVVKPLQSSLRINLKLLRGHKNFGWFLLAMFVFNLSALPIALVLLKSPEIGLGFKSVPLFYFVTNLAFVLFSIPLGKLSDRVGERTVITMGFGGAALAYAGLAFAQSFVALALSFIILGFNGAATDGIRRALASKLLPSELLGTGQGILHATVGLASLFAGVIGGFLWQFLGSQIAFFYAIATSAIGAVLFVILTSGKRRESQ